MSFCLVADVSCDLPSQYLSHPQLRLLPTHIFTGKERFVDTRNAAETERFYLTNLASPDAVQGRSEPMTADEMLAAFNHHLALNFDNALGVFVASSRSAIYVRAKSALARARIQAYATRAKAGKFQPLQADCLDSQSLFAAYAAQVLDLLDYVERGESMMTLIERQQKIAKSTYGYFAPGDVSYILRRAAFKGEKSVSALAGFAAKSLSIIPIIQGHLGKTAPVGRKFGKVKVREALLQMAVRSMQQGLLLSKHVCLSYSGDLQDISSMPAYAHLLAVAKKAHVKVHLAQMSMTGSVNVGPDGLCLGMVAKEHAVSDLL